MEFEEWVKWRLERSVKTNRRQSLMTVDKGNLWRLPAKPDLALWQGWPTLPPQPTKVARTLGEGLTGLATLQTKLVKAAQPCPTLQPHGPSMAFSSKERVAFLFSRGSSPPRDWTLVCHIAGRFFTSWATRAAEKAREHRNLFSLVSNKTAVAWVQSLVGSW